MSSVAVIAIFEAKPNTEAALAEFFRNGLDVLQSQPVSTGWLAFRTGRPATAPSPCSLSRTKLR